MVIGRYQLHFADLLVPQVHLVLMVKMVQKVLPQLALQQLDRKAIPVRQVRPDHLVHQVQQVPLVPQVQLDQQVLPEVVGELLVQQEQPEQPEQQDRKVTPVLQEQMEVLEQPVQPGQSAPRVVQARRERQERPVRPGRQERPG